MNEKLKKGRISPLWVISSFVSLTEIVAGGVCTQTTGGVQLTLVVFVVTFPVLIAACFFLILWFRPYVFYPPSDFGETDVAEYVQAMQNKNMVDKKSPDAQSYLAIFLVKAKTKSGKPLHKILTYYSVIWESYLLPNCRYNANVNIHEQYDPLRRKFAEKMGIKSLDHFRLLKADETLDFSNIKYSYGEKRDVKYFYKFFFIEFLHDRGDKNYLDSAFKVGQKEFKWLSVSEMKSIEKTYSRNSDIIRALSVKFDKLDSIPVSFNTEYTIND